MREQSIKKNEYGFNTLELLIALALFSVIMATSIQAIFSAQYWFMTASVSQEAVQKSNELLYGLENISTENFQLVSSTAPRLSRNSESVSDADCIAGGFCYTTEVTVTDVSSCAKEVSVSVRWKFGERYATSSVTQPLYLSNLQEIVATGGDCIVKKLAGNWLTASPQLGGMTPLVNQQNTGIDVLGQYLYVTSITAPQFRIFSLGPQALPAPLLVGSSSGGVRLNDVEVVRDFKTGRSYAYVMKHSSSSQLAVYDVTDSTTPMLLREITLFNVASNGSFPQGWRVTVYGGQLFAVSRETTGPELHIFSITDPTTPVEITSSALNLNRTVNDMVVRDEIVNGVFRRFLYLVASADLKELGVYDVTNLVPVEIAAINLAGTADASAIYLNGNTVYLGRKSSAVSELYAFNLSKLIRNELEVLGVSELGTEVLALSGTGNSLVVGTGKSGSELQIWTTDTTKWREGVVHAGQLSSMSSLRLAPLGIDVGQNNLYLMSQSPTQLETISVIFAP